MLIYDVIKLHIRLSIFFVLDLTTLGLLFLLWAPLCHVYTMASTADSTHKLVTWFLCLYWEHFAS